METQTAQAPTAEQKVATALEFSSKILRAYGFAATADLAEHKAQSTDVAARSVVVVGEVKRGKSSLVNALLGSRDASPVDVDIATSASLHFVTASDAYPPNTVELVFPGSVMRVPSETLVDWVTHTGRRVGDPTIESLPTRAVIPVHRPRLVDTIVVDTPGAGGLEAAHAQLALHSAQQACVLLVVCDATTPITAPEMAFLRDASASIESIVVAVTKTDKNVRRWKPIVAENHRLIKEHLNRTVPVMGVSSVRALAAADLDNPDRRARSEETSGIVALRRLITERLALSEHHNAVNGLRTAVEGLRKVAEKIADDIRIIEETEVVLPELEAHRDQLQSLKDHSGQWELHMSRDMTFARQAALTHLDEQLDEIRAKWTTRVNKSGLTLLRKNSQVFTQEMETDLMAALAGTIELFLMKVNNIVGPLFRSEVVWNDICQIVMASLHEPDQLSAGEVAKKRQGLLDPAVLSMGMMGTSMLGALLGVGAIAGVVWIGVNLGYKAMRAGKQNLLTWLRETLGITKTAASRMLEAAMTTSRTEIVLRYRDQLRTQMEHVQKQLADAKEAAQLDATTRKNTLTRLSKNLNIVTTRADQIEALITELNTPPTPTRNPTS